MYDLRAHLIRTVIGTSVGLMGAPLGMRSLGLLGAALVVASLLVALAELVVSWKAKP
jgi:hypothetical protein